MANNNGLTAMEVLPIGLFVAFISSIILTIKLIIRKKLNTLSSQIQQNLKVKKTRTVCMGQD